MATITINNREFEAVEGETILAAINRAGYKVPTLCHMKELTPTGACRLCVVDVEGFPGLVPSCSYPVANGMKIQTHSARAVLARKTIIELLLASHPNDCLYCVRTHNCELNALAREYGVTQQPYPTNLRGYHLDTSSLSIVRDPDKCILCGKCVRVCEEIQSVSALDFIGRGSKAIVGCAFEEGINVSSCINCGQCIMVCPTGALTERTNIKQVFEALNDPDKVVVIQHAPSISVTIAEEFGLKKGLDAIGKMTAAMKRIGFDYVFDTSFSADLTIMEEASELVYRIQNNKPLPMMTSCSPGWVKFVEEFYPHLIANISTCKSPQMMLGSVIKNYWAVKKGIDPHKVVSVSIMPCTAKKFEAGRPEMRNEENCPDIDYALTTRELAEMIRLHGINFEELEPEETDRPFGERSTAGKIFGASGGVMEAAYRTAYYLITGQDTDELNLEVLRGLEGIKQAKVKIGELEVGVAVASGLGNARKLLDDIEAGRVSGIHFIEVMTCPGGCINGGGQPLKRDLESIKARMKALYDIDKSETIRRSHDNPAIKELYQDFLGEPLSEKSHHLLHTHYVKRDVLT